MHGLNTLFPATDCSLILVILVMPLLGAIVNGLFGKRLGKSAVTLMALSAVGVAFLASVTAYSMLLTQQAQAAHAVGSHAEHPARLAIELWRWFQISAAKDGGPVPIDVAFSIDALSGTMALVVTGVGFLIHLYSTKYMEHDPSYHRFFAYLNLFIFSMLVLILGDNLAVLFVGWEGVGLCSYLLIGFWFEEEKNAAAGKKAFITNRIGDFGLLVAMGLLVYYVGALDWQGIQEGAHRLVTGVELTPTGGDQLIAKVFHALGVNSVSEWFLTPRYAMASTLVALMLFLGCAGKSAQLPLYVWLPDAMAGPTPVSALIHAATMVTAGVYLVCRMAPVFALSPSAMFVIALVGALTALLAASIAFAQKDIKKVLAYSTVSQLGYMFLGVGVGAFTAGFFHVLTHAFFKACLFLGAGSVIHAMHARIHDGDASQDMSFMGGLRRYMPLTFVSFAASWLAIVGFPGTSGFFSKDEILLKAFTSSIGLPNHSGMVEANRGAGGIPITAWPSWGSSLLFTLGVAGAVMTAFYMTRLFVGTFLGEFKGWTIIKGHHAAHNQHGHDDAGHQDGPVAGLDLEGEAPHESPWQMTLPLVVLGSLALFAGLLNMPLFGFEPLGHFLEPVFASVHTVVVRPHEHELAFSLLPFGILAFALGTGTALWVYVAQRGVPAQRFVAMFPGFHRLVADKWRVDEFYKEVVIGALELVADILVWVDKWVVDGLLARVTAGAVAISGALLRLLQTGRLQTYATAMVIGLTGIGWYLTVPHATAAVLGDVVTGTYTLEAPPGIGYAYRWDANGDGKFESEKFAEKRNLELKLERTERRQVVLEVRSAFGQIRRQTFSLERPAEDKSTDLGVQRIDVYPDSKGGRKGVVRRQPGQPNPIKAGSDHAGSAQ